MQTRIQGTVMPVLEVRLEPNDSIFAESGELSWMTSSIQMSTHTQLGGGGGLMGMFKRVVGGGSLFMTEYRAVQAPGEVAFATKVPGHIVPVSVSPGNEYLVHRHGFLCATPNVTIGAGFQQSLGAGIFGGDGFRLQRVGGSGTAWLELSGELIRKDLAPAKRCACIPVMSVRSRHQSVSRSPRCPASRTPSLAATASFSPHSPAPARYGCRRCRSPGWHTRWPNICPATRAAAGVQPWAAA